MQQIQGSCGAFAAILGGGSVVSWGARRCGDGCSQDVQKKLKKVQQSQAKESAFSAILGDEYVGMCGAADCIVVQACLAAILRSGSVVTWGLSELSGDMQDHQTWQLSVLDQCCVMLFLNFLSI